MRDCEECGRENRRGGRWCAACHRRRYYRTPNGRAAIFAANKRYAAKVSPGQRREWVRNWQFRAGLYNPDLRALRAANKRVEQALAEATRRQRLRGPGERGGDDDPERGD